MRNSLTIIFTIILLSVSLNAQQAVSNNSSQSASNADAGARKDAFRPTKAQITAAQQKLLSAGIYSGAADGKYNDDFRAGLKNFQEKNGLAKTGRLDETTLGKMGIDLSDRQKGIESVSDKPKRAVFRPTKEQITAVQNKLGQAGSNSTGETGKYSPELRTAIREYQSANGLKRKGSLNRATLEKMGIELTEEQAAVPVNPGDLAAAGDGAPKKRGPVFRATKEQVTEVQTKLKSAGLYTGDADGKFNDDFRTSIKAWQEANGVKQTGTLNKATLEAMKIELTQQQKEM